MSEIWKDVGRAAFDRSYAPYEEVEMSERGQGPPGQALPDGQVLAARDTVFVRVKELNRSVGADNVCLSWAAAARPADAHRHGRPAGKRPFP